MLDSKKKKILVIFGIAAVLVVLVVFAFFTNKSSDSTPTNAEKTKIAGERNQLVDLPTATSTPIGQYEANPSPTKSVIIGDLDWTKNQKVGDESAQKFFENYKFNSPEEQARVQSDDPCAIAGLNDNWSDPFEKTMCGLTRYAGNQIIEPLNKIACNFSGAALAANYGSQITSKFVNEKCYILDRK